jgi:hypothetical protein
VFMANVVYKRVASTSESPAPPTLAPPEAYNSATS